MLKGIFETLYSSTITTQTFLISSATSIILGLVIAYVYKTSETMKTSLILLPFLVQIVILLVNGNLGTGLAVAGAFSLVRFRSAPGSSRDIMVIFLSMTVGLSCGMGYCLLAVFVTLISSILLLILNIKPKSYQQEIKVTIPENLDYSNLFDDLFDEYTTDYKLLHVRTINMGSLYKLHYQITLKDINKEKELLDAMRCRNGNLEISSGIPSSIEGVETI